MDILTPTHCLDACAVIAYLCQEAEAGVLKEIIERPNSLLAMHMCNLGEVYYDFFSVTTDPQRLRLLGQMS